MKRRVGKSKEPCFLAQGDHSTSTGFNGAKKRALGGKPPASQKKKAKEKVGGEGREGGAEEAGGGLRTERRELRGWREEVLSVKEEGQVGGVRVVRGLGLWGGVGGGIVGGGEGRWVGSGMAGGCVRGLELTRRGGRGGGKKNEWEVV